MILALVVAGVMNFVSYWFSDKIVLKMYRGREVSPAEAPRFHAIVDRLIVRAESAEAEALRPPRRLPERLRDRPQPAARRGRRDRGHPELDERRGARGGHRPRAGAREEPRHPDLVGRRDDRGRRSRCSRTMARWGAMFGGYGSNDDRGAAAATSFTLLLTAILAPIAAMIIQMAVSRSREFAADADRRADRGTALRARAGAREARRRYSKRLPMPATPGDRAHVHRGPVHGTARS